MTSTAPKLRIVRCPKCSKLLLEAGDVPVYQCGGCGATLKAKNFKVLESANSEDQELGSSKQGEVLCSTEACKEQLESGDCNNENSESRSVTTGVPSSGDLTCHEEERLPSEAREKKADSEDREFVSPRQCAILYSTGACERLESGARSGRVAVGIASSGDLSGHEEEGSFSEAGEKKEAYGKNVTTSNSQTPSPGGKLISGGSSSTSTSERQSVDKQLEKSQRVVVYHAPDDTPSRDTEETTDDSIISEDMFDTELTNSLEDSSKPKPNRRRYPAYDGSVSSCDGLDDQAAFVAPRQRRVRGDVAVNNKIITNKAQRQESRLLTGPVAMDSNQNGLLRRAKIREEEAGARYSEEFHPVKKWLELGREDFLSQDPSSPAGSENSVPLDYRRGDYLPSSSLYPPDKLDLVERNQIELLKKVDELTDQLNRSYVHRGEATTRFPTRSSEQDMLQRYDVNYPQRCREIYGVRSTVSRQSSPSYGVQAHGYQEDWQGLQKLPQPNMGGYNEGIYRAYPGHIWYSPYSSSPSSPQRRPLPPQKTHHRERHPSVKRHCLPMAGGSPLISCYSCWKLLQLPSDFLASSKRRHLLRCRSCSEVLVFSLHRGTHLLPYSPKAGNSSAASNVASPSWEARVSYSEDCGGDCSEGGGGSTYRTPTFSPSQSKSVKKKWQPEIGKRKPPAIEPSDCESSSPKDAKLKTKARPRAVGPSLHRLMGYSSAREIMNTPAE